MFYREAGQYKTSYAADQAVFPMLQDRIGIAVILFIAFVVDPADHVELHALVGDDPGPDLLARGDRAQHPHRLYRPDLARHRRLHGGRRLRLLQAHDLSSRRQHHRADPRCRDSSRRRSASLFGLPSLRIKGFYLAVATLAAQFFLSWCFIRMPWLYNYNVSGAIEVPTRTHVRHSDHRPERDARSRAISSCSASSS